MCYEQKFKPQLYEAEIKLDSQLENEIILILIQGGYSEQKYNFYRLFDSNNHIPLRPQFVVHHKMHSGSVFASFMHVKKH